MISLSNENFCTSRFHLQYIAILLAGFPILHKKKLNRTVDLSILMNLLAKEYIQKKRCVKRRQTLCSCTLVHARTRTVCISASALQSKRRAGRPYLGNTDEAEDFFEGRERPNRRSELAHSESWLVLAFVCENIIMGLAGKTWGHIFS